MPNHFSAPVLDLKNESRGSGYKIFSCTLNKSIGDTESTDVDLTVRSATYTGADKSISTNELSNTINMVGQIHMEQDNRLVHLYFDREPCKLQITPDIQKMIDSQPRKIVMCHSWSDLPNMLNSSVKSICFADTELNHSSAVEIVNMVNTMCKLVGLNHAIPIAIKITKETKYETVKLLQKSNVFGIMPVHYDFGIDESLRSCAALWAHIPYWPKHIMNQLPGAKKRTEKKIPGNIKLTARQQQIYDLIKNRGASNKVIAKTLNITESTVKLHVGVVLKKFGVKNRTQLAVFTKDTIS